MIQPIFRRLLAAFSLCALLSGGSLPAHAQTVNALEIGIIPYLSTPTILEQRLRELKQVMAANKPAKH